NAIFAIAQEGKHAGVVVWPEDTPSEFRAEQARREAEQEKPRGLRLVKDGEDP
ncbi:MAG: hypothetical protein UY85_C0019G0014, partial [Candidatus Peribacteria bacterium GW2011_GWB1_54_5]